ncbi:hypothetical protein AAHC03_022952 [Spirometra sp. Aus1]
MTTTAKAAAGVYAVSSQSTGGWRGTSSVANQKAEPAALRPEYITREGRGEQSSHGWLHKDARLRLCSSLFFGLFVQDFRGQDCCLYLT